MNIKAWSGTHHRILQSLVAFGGVVTLGPADAKLAKMRHFLSKIIAATRGEKYLVSQTISVSKYLGRIFQERINGENYDLLFAPAASSEIAYLETKIPIIYLSDTTFALMVDYYEGFSKSLPDQEERPISSKQEHSPMQIKSFFLLVGPPIPQ